MSRGALPFQLLLLRGRPGWAWPLLGLVLAAVATFQVFVALGLLNEVPYLIGEDELAADLAIDNLLIAGFIPAVCLAAIVACRAAPGFLASVTGRLRMRWLLVCLVATTALLVAVAAVAPLLSGVVPETASYAAYAHLHAHHLGRHGLTYLAVVILTTPLQAAGEEFLFRGYLLQVLGRLTARTPRLGVCVAVTLSALLFATYHGSQNLPLFLDRFTFGLVLGVVAVRTGGLEAGIAFHTVINVLVFVVAVVFGDLDGYVSGSAGRLAASWVGFAESLVEVLLFAAVALVLAPRRRVATRAEPLPEPAETPEVPEGPFLPPPPVGSYLPRAIVGT